MVLIWLPYLRIGNWKLFSRVTSYMLNDSCFTLHVLCYTLHEFACNFIIILINFRFMVETKDNKTEIEEMFSVGAHFGFSRSRRHPSALPYIFGSKNRVEIFDLEKTKTLLDIASEYARKLGEEGKTVLFVGGKKEARESIKDVALKLDMPYVSGRWIGGTLSNFGNIRGRVEKMIDLADKKEKGELSKYTKKERLLIDREIERLDRFFGGLVNLTRKPDALFVIDPRQENISVSEARQLSIPVIALIGSDGDAGKVDYPIFGNDASLHSIKFFTDKIVEAYEEGKKSSQAPKVTTSA